MSGAGWQPAPDGFREVRFEANTGVAIDQRSPAEIKAAQEKVEARRKADMERYAARSKAHQEELVKRAAGIRDEPEPEPEKPFDELDLVLQQFQVEPHLLHGRGPLGDQLNMSGGGVEARKLRARAELDARQVEAAATLTNWLSPTQDETDDDVYDYRGVSDEKADELLAEYDPDEDDDFGWLEDDEGDET